MSANFAAATDSLRAESDRGSVIVAGAWMEDLLSDAIQKRLLPSPEQNDKLFGPRGPLGTFAAKIDIAHRVSLITREVRKSLHICRRLRNDFAHVAHPISFDTESVKDRVTELFELNKDVLSTVWSTTAEHIPADYRKTIDETEPSSAIRQALGTRPLFDLTAGTIVSGLTMVVEQTERVESLE
ncbi:hypothetical protein T35B1_17501 [Salinisphaera shabanensis T35B1]|uniref:hypothetical protein n=1 Tax=Salinisphaera shabanensis TaxID=180542 RepID=UPI00333EBFAA